jgi:uncharacterized protein
MVGFNAAQRSLRKLMRSLVILLAVILLTSAGFALPASATSVSEIPNVTTGEQTWIIDEAEILSRINEGKISNGLKQLQTSTGDEVRFVTFRRLDYGETIDSFTDKLFTAWFPTPESQENQAILALDISTNTAALRTGEALKTRLTEDIATSISDETMMAPIRKGDQYNQSFSDASDRLIAVLSGQEDPGPPIIIDETRVEGTFASVEETKESNATVIVIVLLILATVIPMVTYYAYVR